MAKKRNTKSPAGIKHAASVAAAAKNGGVSKKGGRRGKKAAATVLTEPEQRAPGTLRDIAESKKKSGGHGRKNRDEMDEGFQRIARREPREVGAFKRLFGETDYQFNRRMEAEVANAIRLSKMQQQGIEEQPEMAAEIEKKIEKKREKRRARATKKKERKTERNSEKVHEAREREMLTDKVQFGEVVLCPPTLKPPKGVDVDQPASQTFLFSKLFAKK